MRPLSFFSKAEHCVFCLYWHTTDIYEPKLQKNNALCFDFVELQVHVVWYVNIIVLILQKALLKVQKVHPLHHNCFKKAKLFV